MYRFVGVIGGNTATALEYSFAERLGSLLGKAGYSVVCGGGAGVMEAVCRGCLSAGGLTLGILPGDDPGAANRFVSVAVPTGIGFARNRTVALCGLAVCAVGGSYGTLSEIAFALQAGKPVSAWGTWSGMKGVHSVATPDEAVEFVMESDGRNADAQH
jgi:uncharacterized protein (TIGR00725 family)